MIPLRYNPDKNILNEYYELINSGRSERHLKEVDLKCRKHLGKSFKDVVLCSPSEISDYCKNLIKNSNYSFIKDEFYNICVASGNNPNDYIVNTLYKKMPHKARRLIYRSVDTKVCPYCNRNFIEELRKNSGGRDFSGTFELDHFYPKDEFPMFAVSFYNLIPVCSTCNSLKNNYVFYNNPYLIERESGIKFGYNILGTDFLREEDDIDIVIYGDDKEELKTAKILHLAELYNGHKDIAQEIIKKIKYYNPSYIKCILKLDGKLFSSVEELYRLLYGGYANSEEFGKRPLSKFIKDIYQETINETGGYDILLNSEESKLS